ncbi:MAG: MgtC/SapB family protein [Gemmataceae bacterium]
MTFLAFATAVGSALLAGIAIGLERQYRQHPAGLRTNALVCVGAAAFVTVSQLVHDVNSPTRIASYVVSGIGFLGGGVILREGLTVRGLNTAATLWCSAAVGVLCGSGYAVYGMGITATVLAINVGLRPLARWIDARRRGAADLGAIYQLQVVCGERDAAVVRNVILRHVNAHPGLSVQGVSSQDSDEPGRETIAAEVLAGRSDDKAIAEVMNRLSIEPGVWSVRWEKRSAEVTA